VRVEENKKEIYAMSLVPWSFQGGESGRRGSSSGASFQVAATEHPRPASCGRHFRLTRKFHFLEIQQK
jgi:hypothetical protein